MYLHSTLIEMEYYSIVKGGRDMIIDSVYRLMQLWQAPGKPSEYEKKLAVKIREIMKGYETQWFYVDGQRIKHLEWSFFEFCISAGGTKYLIRIFFFQQNKTFIVLTWNLIKPENYQDKKNTDRTDLDYQNELKFCKQIQQDFLWEKKLVYQKLEI